MYHKSEPSRDGITPSTTWDLVYAFKWYNDNVSDADAAKYLNTDITTAKRFLTLAWAERLKTRGFVFPEKEQQTYLLQRSNFDAYILALEKTKIEKPVVDVQERIKQKTFDLLDLYEQKFYEWVNQKIAVDFHQYFLNIGVKPQHVSLMIKEIELLQSEMKQNLHGPALAALKKISETKKTIERKPRKKKPVDPTKLVGQMKYAERCDELGLVSIQPETILKAEVLWTFNTKYRILGFIQAKQGETLSVKGCTIVNFDEISSTKTIRNPEKMFPDFLIGTFPRRQKIFNEIKAKPAKITGRINKDVVLLKVEHK